MTTDREFLAAAPFGPSGHLSMSLDERIVYYRRIIGWLRLCEKKKLSFRLGFELRSAHAEAQSILGSNYNEGECLSRMIELLQETMTEKRGIK